MVISDNRTSRARLSIIKNWKEMASDNSKNTQHHRTTTIQADLRIKVSWSIYTTRVLIRHRQLGDILPTKRGLNKRFYSRIFKLKLNRRLRKTTSLNSNCQDSSIFLKLDPKKVQENQVHYIQSIQFLSLKLCIENHPSSLRMLTVVCRLLMCQKWPTSVKSDKTCLS